MTLKTWDAHPDLQIELKAILANPTLRLALDIVKNLGIAPVAPPPLGVNLMHFSSLVGARKEGYIEALSNLNILSQKTPAKMLAQPPWERGDEQDKLKTDQTAE